ncbi:MAG: hypothetical protein V1913_02730 [Fibrobacterota bacterium]
MSNKVSLALFALLLAAVAATATESRIESMGKRDVFFRDDMGVFVNPAEIGVLGNFVTGTLGFVNDVSETTYTVSGASGDTLINGQRYYRQFALDTVVKPQTATPTNQWFGVVYNLPVSKTVSLFGGAAFNRTDELLGFYDAVRRDRYYKLEGLYPALKGRSDFMFGLKMKNFNVGVGYYTASQHKVEDYVVTLQKPRYDFSFSLNKVNLGTEIGFGAHSLEVYGSVGNVTYSNENNSTTPFDTLTNIKETSDKSLSLGSRFFFQTKIGGGVVFVPAFNYKKLAILDSTQTSVGGGVGLNYRLDGGFFWCGVEGETYTRENTKDTITVEGNGARFNFGIEKSLIWKWLIVRVGGNKFIATETETKKIAGTSVSTSRWVQNKDDDGTSEDLLGFGIGLNYQNRLRFDITLNEAMPYFNPFGDGLKDSPNGGHMLLRICSTFSL